LPEFVDLSANKESVVLESSAEGIRKTDVIRTSQSQWKRRHSWSRKEWNES
jgi:hypothetical protein